MKKTLLTLSLAGLTMMPAGAVQTREKLNRAPVAVMTKTGILVSWRALSSDAAGTAFNVYRNGTAVVKGLTAKTKEEKRELLEMLVSTTGGTNLMHEGFDAEDPSKYTRPWFAWSCSLFCEFVMNCLDEGVI